MLFFVGAWALLVVVTVPLGLAVLHWTNARAFDRPGDRIVLSVWIGLLALGNLLLAAAFLTPVGPAAGLVVFATVLAVGLSSSAVRREIRSILRMVSPRLLVALAIFVAGLAFLTAQPVVWTDTGLYHAGAIRWLSEFGAVDGIGLVHFRFGFASSWLALAAPFNPAGSQTHAVAVLGGLGLLLLYVHALVCLHRAIAKRARTADWFVLVAAALMLLVLGGQRVFASANPDLPVAVLALLIAWTMLTISRTPTAHAQVDERLLGTPHLIPFLLALGAVTIKLQSAPLVVVSALFFAGLGTVWPWRVGIAKRLLVALGLGFVCLAPWLAYEFTVSGCPAFPAPVCLDVPWSVGPDVAEQASDAVRDWSRTRTYGAPEPGLSWADDWLTRNLSRELALALLASSVLIIAGAVAARRARAGSWQRGAAIAAGLAGFLGLSLVALTAQEVLIAALAALSLIPLKDRSAGAGWLLALGLAGISVLLITAPDPRFALGYMAVLFGRIVVFQAGRLEPFAAGIAAGAAHAVRVGLPALLVLAGLIAVTGRAARPTTSLADTLNRPGLVTPPETAPVGVRLQRLNGISYRVPGDGLCWEAALPCTPDGNANPRVVLRDSERGIAGGFEISAP